VVPNGFCVDHLARKPKGGPAFRRAWYLSRNAAAKAAASFRPAKARISIPIVLLLKGKPTLNRE